MRDGRIGGAEHMAAKFAVLPNEAAIKTLPIPASGREVYWLKGKVEGRDVPRGLGVRVTAIFTFPFLSYRLMIISENRSERKRTRQPGVISFGSPPNDRGFSLRSSA